MGLLLIGLLATVIQVRVTTVDGQTREVTLQGVRKSEVVIESSGNQETIAIENLLALERVEPSSTTPPTMRVELFGGSRIAAASAASSGSDIELTIPEQPSLQIPLNQVRWLRFRPSSPATDPQWLGMIDNQRTADVLVVRRAGDALDEVQGIVKSITKDSVKIDLDGDDLDAPVAKLEGVLFANSSSVASSGSVIIEDIQGSRWHAKSLNEENAGSLTLEFSEGIKHVLPLDQLSRIETTGAVQFLAKEEPAEDEFSPSTKIGIDPALAKQWLSVGTDGNDLIMQAESHVEYRLSDQFSTLIGSVQFDPSVSAGGKCSLRILLDDNVVWDQLFDVDDPAQRGYELPIGKARRLRFEVKTGGDGDLGDTLRIRQPRLVK
jgi:hypothetical protein